MGQIFPDADLSKEFKSKTRRKKKFSRVILTRNYFFNSVNPT